MLKYYDIFYKNPQSWAKDPLHTWQTFSLWRPNELMKYSIRGQRSRSQTHSIQSSMVRRRIKIFHNDLPGTTIAVHYTFMQCRHITRHNPVYTMGQNCCSNLNKGYFWMCRPCVTSRPYIFLWHHLSHL